MNPDRPGSDRRCPSASGNAHGDASAAPSGTAAAVEEITVLLPGRSGLSRVQLLPRTGVRAGGLLIRGEPVARFSQDEELFVEPDDCLTDGRNAGRLEIGITLYRQLCALKPRILRNAGKVVPIDPDDRAAGWCMRFRRRGKEDRVAISAANSRQAKLAQRLASHWRRERRIARSLSSGRFEV